MQQHSRTGRVLLASLLVLVAAAAATVLADDSTPLPASAGGTVTVYSFPPGGAVDLDGTYRGITPLTLENVPPGKYLVTVSKAGCRNVTIPITVNTGSVFEIGATLESASASVPEGFGSVAVDSSPGGASVTLDGKPAGQTPAGHAALVLDSVPAGSHTVTVELAGYPRYSENITVAKNRVAQVSADLLTTPAATPVTTVFTKGTPAASPSASGNRNAVPLSPLAAIAAAGLAGTAAVFRRG